MSSTLNGWCVNCLGNVVNTDLNQTSPQTDLKLNKIYSEFKTLTDKKSINTNWAKFYTRNKCNVRNIHKTIKQIDQSVLFSCTPLSPLCTQFFINLSVHLCGISKKITNLIALCRIAFYGHMHFSVCRFYVYCAV